FTADATHHSVDRKSGERDGLTVTPNSTVSNEDFTLTVTSTATDGTSTAPTVATIHVTSTEVADAPNLDVDAGTAGNQLTVSVSGAEDTAIAIPVTTSLVESGAADADATLATVVSDIPTGAILSDGTVANTFTADATHHS